MHSELLRSYHDAYGFLQISPSDPRAWVTMPKPRPEDETMYDFIGKIRRKLAIIKYVI